MQQYLLVPAVNVHCLIQRTVVAWKDKRRRKHAETQVETSLDGPRTCEKVFASWWGEMDYVGRGSTAHLVTGTRTILLYAEPRGILPSGALAVCLAISLA